MAAFHKALDDGAADAVLDSLRPAFDAAAEAIAAAKALGINAESAIGHILASAQPGAIEAWQQPDGHLATSTPSAPSLPGSARDSATSH